MLFTRKPLFIACAIASSVLFTACSNNTEEKKQDSLTASAPATGEASTLTERNAKQRLIDTLQKHFKTANIHRNHRIQSDHLRCPHEDRLQVLQPG